MLPLYLEKLTPDELSKKAESLYELLSECKICPNECLSDRLKSETGKCNSANTIQPEIINPFDNSL